MDYSIDIREKDGVRSLHFESHWTQGAMRITHPSDLVLEYTRTMMASLLMRVEKDFPQNVLLIGLGAGSLTKFLYQHYPTASLTIVEIDPRVIDVARKHFELPDDPIRLKIVIGDGVEYMAFTNQTYDLIIIDGFNDHAHPGELNSFSFYQACRLRLNKLGILVVNLIGLSDGVKGGLAHIEVAFENRAIRFPRCKSGNTIAFAATGEPVNIPISQLMRGALELRSRTGLSLIEVITKFDAGHSAKNGTLIL
jgi:spermidine synthase